MREVIAANGLHLRVRDGAEPPLLCLPPAPHSSLYFDPLYAALDPHPVRGISYPGYGGSARLSGPPSIDTYATAIAQTLDDDGPVDLLGFHTGCLVAAALAKQVPDRIRQIVMIDVPFFDAETRAAYAAKLPPDGLPVPVEASFAKSVTRRHSATSEDRAFALWVETLRAGRHQADAFRAAFAYDCEAELSMLDWPVHVVATASGLLEPTRRAAAAMAQAELLELPDVSAPVFDAHADVIAQTILTIIKSPAAPPPRVAQ